MSGRITLLSTAGPMNGKQFVFDEHDTFLFGRMPDCHACLPDDPAVSRHHFIMEVNPPDARIRDLKSMNGTYVNGRKHGGRKAGETPEQGAQRRYPEVDVKHGDQIQVGDTVLAVHVELPAECCQCGRSIADADRQRCAWVGGTSICSECRARLAASLEPECPLQPVRCQRCGRDVADEVGAGQRGAYVCRNCRAQVGRDPAALLRQLVESAAGRSDGLPPQITGYVIEEKLGQGGMGAVYLARRKADGQAVAVKVMLSQVAVDEKSKDMFMREMETVRSLHHPHIVDFIDHGAMGTAFYFIMEFCNRGSVDGTMERHGGRLPLKIAWPIVFQSLQGLAYAHEQDFVHRDLKPQNILLSAADDSVTVKVTDFGLAKNFQRAGFSGMTVTGATAGTPAFMPREQVTSFRHVKPASDVWSMGATFYNMLTGELPRECRPGQDPMEAVLHGAIVPILTRDRSIPVAVAEIIDRSLAVQPRDRYQHAGEMLAAMESVR